uniref:Uncharacterized protein n=1 Tax=Timema poppense TaxID=170557 RepID=A0A7R9H4H6_TIMPO|nr:unnamed protein product [Timema poppensis]
MYKDNTWAEINEQIYQTGTGLAIDGSAIDGEVKVKVSTMFTVSLDQYFFKICNKWEMHIAIFYS